LPPNRGAGCAGQPISPSSHPAFVGWFANTAALLVAVEVLLLPVWLAKLLAVMASFTVNFSLSHFVVFRVRRSLPATT
jgi:putative flippase GtrA